MQNKLRFILLLLLLAALIAAAAFAYQKLSAEFRAESGVTAAQTTQQATQAGQTTQPEKIAAPDFTVYDLDGNEARLSDMLGLPVVLNFWASWCSPCKEEMPDFEQAFAELGGDVVFMMVNMTDGVRETLAAGSKYIADNGFSFPVYYDTGQDAAYTYGIRSIPTTIFIDAEGYIVAGHEGMLDAELLRVGMDLLIGNPE